MICTGRYSNKNLRTDGYYQVGISVGRPKFPLGYELRDQCYMLAPRRDMLSMEKARYKNAYYAKLDAAGEQKVINYVRNLEKRAEAEGKKLALLCFEDIRNPEDWCHRRMFAEWWQEHTGEAIEEIPEVDPPRVKKTKAAALPRAEEKKEAEPEDTFEQLSLFFRW